MDAIFRHILAGMKLCAERGKFPATVGIDTWAVDFVLLDRTGSRLCDAVSYRDDRTEGWTGCWRKRCRFSELYAETGIQKQPFNTVYQLLAVQRDTPGMLERAERLLMLPGLLSLSFDGEKRQEYTNATTTSLVSAATGEWSAGLLERMGLPRRLFGPLAMPGTAAGTLLPQIAAEVGV